MIKYENKKYKSSKNIKAFFFHVNSTVCVKIMSGSMIELFQKMNRDLDSCYLTEKTACVTPASTIYY